MSSSLPMINIIDGEEAAFDLLEGVLAEEQNVEGLVFAFVGWPKVDIYLPNTPIDASISSTMMEALLELQTSIYRSYLLVNTDSGDLRGLSKSERARLEIRVKVMGGSSEYLAELSETINKVAGSVVAKMSSRDLLVAVLGIAIVVGGAYSWQAWLSARTEQRAAELEHDEKKEMLLNQRDLLAHGTRQMEILAKAFERQPILHDVEAAAESARQEMVRALAEEKGGRIQGLYLSQELASELVVQRRQQSVPTQISGLFKVARVDSTLQDGFRVTFTRMTDGGEVTATLQDALLSERHREVLKKAEWSKQPLHVRLSAKMLRNRYVDAIVIDVQDALPTAEHSSTD